MLEKFFYATIITVLLPILLGISPFYKSENLNIQEVTQKDHRPINYADRFSFVSQG